MAAKTTGGVESGEETGGAGEGEAEALEEELGMDQVEELQ